MFNRLILFLSIFTIGIAVADTGIDQGVYITSNIVMGSGIFAEFNLNPYVSRHYVCYESVEGVSVLKCVINKTNTI